MGVREAYEGAQIVEETMKTLAPTKAEREGEKEGPRTRDVRAPSVMIRTVKERERERETERQRDRETERQRDRETERQRDRETERQPTRSCCEAEAGSPVKKSWIHTTMASKASFQRVALTQATAVDARRQSKSTYIFAAPEFNLRGRLPT